MIENRNNRILVNSAVLYAKLAITTICGLATTRFALKALGVTDFGLFSILASILSFIAIINTISAAVSNRYIAIELGKGEGGNANEQFNTNLTIQIAVSIIILMISYPIGKWYIFTQMNYDGNLYTAFEVFCFSIIGSVISFIGVPYNGLLIAKENFLVFSIIDVISHIAKLVVSILLLFYFENKLEIYAFTMSMMTAYPAIVYCRYCKKHYKDIVQIKFCRDWEKYKNVLVFAMWDSYGVVACIAKNQGAAVLVNNFFNTIMNAALGIANTINSFAQLFSQNISKPIAPQIIKSYAAGDISRTTQLLIKCTKYSYLLMLFVCVPFLIETEYILGLWLGEQPAFSVMFTRLLLIETLIDSLNNGIAEIIFAHGKIAFYQITTNTARLISIIVGYYVLRSGGAAYSLLYVYIAITALVVFIKQIALKHTLHFDNTLLLKNSYYPAVLVTTSLLPIILIHKFITPFISIVISECIVLLFVYLFGMSKQERIFVSKFIHKCIKPSTK